MNACRSASVPVGVILQIKQKPNPVYRVLGLGLVSNDQGGVFTIRQYGSAVERAEGALALQVPSEAFDASNLVDARRREMRAMAVRRGQPAFRRRDLDAYGGICAVSGFGTSVVLEAAHIIPYRGDHTNQVCNGILLRADLHTLFDLGLLRIEPTTYWSTSQKNWPTRNTSTFTAGGFCYPKTPTAGLTKMRSARGSSALRSATTVMAEAAEDLPNGPPWRNIH